LPYQVNKAGWIEKVAELVNQGKIHGISDLRDESDRTGMRVVIELKRDTNPQEVIAHLYQQTALQSNFGAILLALVDGQPRQLTLRQLLQEFLNFREQTLNRRYSYELGKAESRLHVVQGLLSALSNLDTVISILRQAADGSTAKITFQNRLNLTEIQADAILSMPLRRLTSLEVQNLQTDFNSLRERIELLRRLLSDRRELLKALKKDLRTLKKKYGDERRTKIVVPSEQRQGDKERDTRKGKQTAQEEQENPQSAIQNLKLELPPEEALLEFSHRGYVRRTQPSSRKSKTENGMAEHDFVIQTTATDTQQELLVLTTGGKVYPLKVGDIPLATGKNSRGKPLLTLLSSTAQNAQESVIHSFIMPENIAATQMVLVTKFGRIKRISCEEFTNLSRRGISIIKLKDNDQLLFTQFTNPGDKVVVASSNGRLLRFTVNEEQLPTMGRTAVGLQALRLLRTQHIVGCNTLRGDGDLLLVTQEGYAKRIPASTLKLSNRGDLGTQSLKFSSKTDNLAAMVLAPTDGEVALVTNTNRVLWIAIDSVPVLSKDGTGKSVVQLSRDEQITSVVTLG